LHLDEDVAMIVDTIDLMCDEDTLGGDPKLVRENIPVLSNRVAPKVQFTPLSAGTLSERIQRCARMILLRELYMPEISEEIYSRAQYKYYRIPDENHGDVAVAISLLTHRCLWRL